MGRLGQRPAEAAAHRSVTSLPGEIVELGPEAAATGLLAIGDRVTAEGHIVCGHCLPCRTGDAHVCRRTSIIGVDRDGAFAEYIAMPASNVIPLETIPTEVGAIMDPIGNAVHTVLEGGNLPGQHRSGGGMRAHRVLRRRHRPGSGRFARPGQRPQPPPPGNRPPDGRPCGPRRIEGGRGGPGHRVDPGDGIDLVCEMSGHPTGHATAFAAVRPGGRVNMLGTPSRTTEVNFARDVIFKGLTIYGVTGRRMYDTWHQMTRLLRARQFDPAPVVTHRFPLERIADAIGVIKDGSAGKVILEIGA